MKGKLVAIGAGALLVLTITLAGLVFDPFANAGPPVPTPVPKKTLLRLGTQTLEENLAILRDASLSQIAASCGNPPGRKISVVTADADIWQGYPNTNYGSSDIMHCGYDDYYEPDGQIMRCLTRFDIPSLPADTTLTTATLYLFMLESWDYPYSTRTYTAYRIPSDWSESAVTWNNAPPPAEAYGSTGVTHGDWGWYSFDVTGLAQAWYDKTYPNYGIMLRGPEWSGSDSSWKAFSTKEMDVGPDDWVTPTLVLDYVYTWPTPPTLGASPTLLRFYAYDTHPFPEPQAVTISNITVGSLDWSAAKVSGAPWLEMDKTSGTVTSSSSDIMSVSVDTGDLTYGTHTERITITKTTDPTDCSNRFVDVVLEYGQAEPWKVFLPVVSKDGVAGEAEGGTPSVRDAVALVVGVAEYPNLVSSTGRRAGGDPNQLQFPDDDARDIRDVLYQAGFSTGNVMTLIDSDATKAAIDAGFNWLDDRENENTLVVVSFSGHGGQVLDTPPYDEADGHDEFIAPQDMTLTGDNIITDDELDEWLSRLESEHVVVVIDSCYSTGMINPAETEQTGEGTVIQ